MRKSIMVVLSQEPIKMHPFLQFIFNAEALREHVRDEWIKLYDYTYIDDKIIGGVEKHLPNVIEVLVSIEKKALGVTQSTFSMAAAKSGDEALMKSIMEDQSTKKKTPTKPEPFNLTKPKPKVIEKPIPLVRELKANPVPKAIYRKTLEEIEKDKQARRKNKLDVIRKEYEGGSVQMFKLKTAETSYDINKVKERISEEEKKMLKFDMKYAKQMPDFDNIEAPVKINTAAIMREGHLLKKKQDIEGKILKDFEMNMRDGSEFNRWFSEMNEKDEIERLEHMQKKKIEMELARNEAIEAKEHKLKENKYNASKMKVESQIREDQRVVEKQVVLEVKKDLITKVQDQRLVAEDEVEKNKIKKKEIRDQIHQEISDALAKRKEEDLAELRKREELIRQIRELEKIPIVRTQGFDPTETAGHGILVEMSIAELRERLEYEKLRRQADADNKRSEIKSEKSKKSDMLTNQTEDIIKARNELKDKKEKERNDKRQKREAEEAKRKEAREKGLLEAYDKISEKKRLKKEEEDRLAAELRKIKLQREYLNAGKSMMEKKAWRELEAGAERQARDKQNNKLLDQLAVNEIKVKDLQVMAVNNKNTVQDKIDYDKGYKDRLETRKMENEILHKEVLEYKTDKYEKQKDQEVTLKVKQQKMNPFKEKINQESKANATKFKNRQQNKTKRMQDDNSDFEGIEIDNAIDTMEGSPDLFKIEDSANENRDKINRMMEMEA